MLMTERWLRLPLSSRCSQSSGDHPVCGQEQHGNNGQPDLVGQVLCSHVPILLTNRTWPLKRGFSGMIFYARRYLLYSRRRIVISSSSGNTSILKRHRAIENHRTLVFTLLCGCETRAVFSGIWLHFICKNWNSCSKSPPTLSICNFGDALPWSFLLGYISATIIGKNNFQPN